MLAARETGPTPVVTRSSEVSCVEPTSSMVLGSRTRGGRSSAAIPDVGMRPEIEFRQEPEIDNAEEIQVCMSAICEGGSGTTRQDIPDTAREYVTADRPETFAAFPSLGTNRIPPITPVPLLLTHLQVEYLEYYFVLGTKL